MVRARRTARKNRDGVTIENLWKMRRVESGRKWRYRVWDAIAGKYVSATFGDDPVEDNDRDSHKPGCAAGDRWAADKRPRVQLQMETAGAASTADIAREYLQTLKDLKRNATHTREVERILSEVAAQAPDMKAKDFRARVEKWRRNLKARKVNDPKAGQREGRVRRVEDAELSPVTVNRYLLHVRSLTAYAVSMAYLPRNPLARLKDLEQPNTIKATFSIPELRTLVGLRDYGNPIWMWASIMALTGCRAQEALYLRWQDVDLANSTISVRHQPGVYALKRAKERTLPLQAGLAELLKAHPAKSDLGWLIPDEKVRQYNNKSRVGPLEAVLKAAGMEPEGRTPHSFRHTYAALMVATREDVFSICRALGHRDLAMTEHYSREAASYRPTIEAESWKPGELRIGPTAKADVKAE